MANYELGLKPGAAERAIEAFTEACRLEPENQEMNDLLNFAIEEAKEDAYVPVPAEKERF